MDPHRILTSEMVDKSDDAAIKASEEGTRFVTRDPWVTACPDCGGVVIVTETDVPDLRLLFDPRAEVGLDHLPCLPMHICEFIDKTSLAHAVSKTLRDRDPLEELLTEWRPRGEDDEVKP